MMLSACHSSLRRAPSDEHDYAAWVRLRSARVQQASVCWLLMDRANLLYAVYQIVYARLGTSS